MLIKYKDVFIMHKKSMSSVDEKITEKFNIKL